MEDRDTGRAAAHFHECDAQLFLVIGQHRVRRGERLQHEVGDAIAGTLHALAEILRRRRLDGDEIHLHLEPRARHSNRVRDAVLLVDDVFLRNVVQQLVIPTQRHRTRDFVHPRDILGADLLGTHGDDAGRTARGHMLTRDAARHVRDPRPRHPLGVLERGGDGARRLVDVAHHPAADAAVFGETDAENLRERGARQIAGELRDHGAGLGAAEIEPGHEAAIRHQTVPPTELLRRTTTCPAKRASSSRYGRAFAARSLATRTTASITSGPASRLSNTR